jgi:hypothetical protein
VREYLMINVLSIDWDYYINASNDIRNEWFPNIPEDILTEEERTELWEPYYKKYNIKTIDLLRDELDKTKNIIRNNINNNKNIIKMVNESHRYIYCIINQILSESREKSITVFNIDHHHDMYQYHKYDEKVNCSNWVTILKEELENNFEYYWIKREDSEEYSLAGKIECNICTIDDISDKVFDIIFLCKSGAWSPPHLDSQYKELTDFMLNTL